MELRECPFCGSEPVCQDLGGWEVYCRNCGASGPTVFHGTTNETTLRADSILTWNRRASPASVPAGWKLVPVEPTEEMQIPSYLPATMLKQIYRDMLAAAPTPSTWPDGTPRAFDNYAHDKRFAEDSPTPPVSEDRWLPIETAPKYGRFLAVMPSGVMSVIVWLEASHPDADGEGWYEHWKFDPVDPTHWMPLPKAPSM